MVTKSKRYMIALLICSYADSYVNSYSLGSIVCFKSSTGFQYRSNIPFITLRAQRGIQLCPSERGFFSPLFPDGKGNHLKVFEKVGFIRSAYQLDPYYFSG